MSKQDDCKHDPVKPAFDLDAARKMTAPEIRRKFPRFYGICPDCGYKGIIYASYEHYIYGDY